MNRIRCAPPASPVFLLALLPAAAPAPQRSARVLIEDFAFARELAVRYQYVDLAEAVLARASGERLDDKQKENLVLVQCEVYLEGAKREGDPERRLAVFGKAAEAYEDFFKRYPYSEFSREAERSYLGLVNNYGRALEAALEGRVGDEQARLRATMEKVLDAGLKRTASLKEDYARPELSAGEKLEKWRLMLDRAEMLTTLGRVTPDPDLVFSQAQKELERMVQEAGEVSGPGLNGCLALARLHLSRGNYADAQAFGEFVVTTAVPEDPETPGWKELTPEVRAERFRLVELAMPGLLESVAAQGQAAAACKWALYFFNAWKREGLKLTPLGTLALLASARTLLDAGGYVGGSMTAANLRWFESEEEMARLGFSARDSRSALDLALKTAQDVNTENKGNTLQIRAQKLISDVISRPGVVVPPDVLLEAALGEYNTQNFAVAIDSLKGVARALDARDEATRREYMPKVLFYLGQSHAQLARPLEAAMAFRDAVTTWAGDPEFQPRAAQGYYREIGNVRKKAPGDALIQSEYLKAEDVFQKSSEGGGADVVKWRQAERAYGQQGWDAARASYLALGPGADEHEKGIVKAALCLYKKNDKAGAKKEFEAYLKAFVPDPKNAISGTRKLVAREEARAQATYYLGKMAFDEQAWDETVRVFGGYEKEFPAQTEYAPNALYMSTLAHVARKDLAAARLAAGTLQASYATNRVTGNAAFSLYQALKSEYEAAQAAGGAARARALKQEMAHFVRVSNRVASEPNFANLRVESTLWLELGDWEAAEESLRRTLAAFEGQKERQEDLERFVRPDLGQALLGQRRVPEAFAVLDPLVPKDESDPRKPSGAVVRDWCRAVVGWVEEEGAAAVEVPGVGGDFKLATSYLDKLLAAEKAANEAWSCPWYALKFAQVYAFFRWSEADSSQRGAAKRILDDVASQLGDPELADVAKKCGDESLRKRFLWLRNRLR